MEQDLSVSAMITLSRGIFLHQTFQYFISSHSSRVVEFWFLLFDHRFFFRIGLSSLLMCLGKVSRRHFLDFSLVSFLPPLRLFCCVAFAPLTEPCTYVWNSSVPFMSLHWWDAEALQPWWLLWGMMRWGWWWVYAGAKYHFYVPRCQPPQLRISFVYGCHDKSGSKWSYKPSTDTSRDGFNMFL